MATNSNCTFTVTIHRQPWCPSCGSALTNDGWRVVCGIAMCDACRSGDGKGLLNIISSMTTYPVGAVVTRRQGVAFYTPSVDGPPHRPPTLISVPPYLDHPRVIQARAIRAEGA